MDSGRDSQIGGIQTNSIGIVISKDRSTVAVMFNAGSLRMLPMSSTGQKINLCKSRNPKLSRNSDSPEFLLLCYIPFKFD